MKQALTTKSLDAMKPATKKRYEVRDTKTPGLHLRVSTTGARTFYTMACANGSRKRVKIGSYPVISLADARRRAMEIARSVELGEFDNAPEAPQETVPTLGDVIPQFIELHAKPNTKDWKRTHSILGKFAVLDDIPIDKIKRKDVVAALDDIVANGTPIRANRALAAVKKLMNWCIDRGLIDTSPVAQLKPPTKEVGRERVLADEELAACWNAASSEGFPFGQFVHLLILTGQRRNEVAGMRWSELDIGRCIWTLPTERSKNGTAHLVPLSPSAISVLKSVPRFLESDLVFTTNGRKPISGFGRLKQRLDIAVGLDAEDWRLHDLRRTMATNMAMMRVQPHIIEAVLNHKTGIISGVAAVYNRHAYLDEKREALELWANKVATLATVLAEPTQQDLSNS